MWWENILEVRDVILIGFSQGAHCPNSVPGCGVEARDAPVRRGINYLVSKQFYPIIEGRLSLAQILIFQVTSGFKP
jgi:hypothetical protein